MIDTTLPLTDIHRHLDGNIVPRPFLNLAASIISRFLHNTGNTDSPRSGHCQRTRSCELLTKLDWGVKVLASLDACRRGHLKTLKMQPVTACTMSSCVFTGLHGNGTSAACSGCCRSGIDGVREGCRTFGVQAKLIGI